jgi:hypothetical protein
MLRSIFNSFCAFFFKSLFRTQVSCLGNRTLYVFDVDNTIADTHPTLLQTYGSETERILSIPSFSRMRNLLIALLQSKSRKVIFMTSRSYLQWTVTHRWLMQQSISASLFEVIIVSSPAEKIQLLTDAALERRIVYIDDLSWNHERGEVKFYETELEAVKKLPVRYIGYKTILRFNSKA